MREYPGRLYHETPAWVKEGAQFHIRLRVATAKQSPLTSTPLGTELLIAAKRYHELGHWWCDLFLLMPDHIHAVMAFPAELGMSVAIKNWKRGTARFQGMRWQEGYFDHRLRSAHETSEKWWYIRRNPVVKSLCAKEDDWPWWWSPNLTNPLSEVERLDPKPLV